MPLTTLKISTLEVTDADFATVTWTSSLSLSLSLSLGLGNRAFFFLFRIVLAGGAGADGRAFGRSISALRRFAIGILTSVDAEVSVSESDGISTVCFNGCSAGRLCGDSASLTLGLRCGIFDGGDSSRFFSRRGSSEIVGLEWEDGAEGRAFGRSPGLFALLLDWTRNGGGETLSLSRNRRLFAGEGFDCNAGRDSCFSAAALDLTGGAGWTLAVDERDLAGI